MADGDQDYLNQVFAEFSTKIRDLEERQRIMKDRLLLIGQNLIEIKESSSKQALEMKKDITLLNQNMERMKDFLETASGEFTKFARKEDLEILSRQAKMFQPLDLIKKT